MCIVPLEDYALQPIDSTWVTGCVQLKTDAKKSWRQQLWTLAKREETDVNDLPTVPIHREDRWGILL